MTSLLMWNKKPMHPKQRLNHYLAPTLFAAAAALFIITGVEYLKVSAHPERGHKAASLYRAATERLDKGFTRTVRAIGIGAHDVEPAKLSRLAIIRHRGEAYQILGIKAGTALAERRAVVRRMSNNQIGEFAAGDRIFGGAKVEKVTPSTVQVIVETPQRRVIQLRSTTGLGRIL